MRQIVGVVLGARIGYVLFYGDGYYLSHPLEILAFNPVSYTHLDVYKRQGMPYVNARWLGGMLTNFATIRTRVKRMEELEAMDADGRMALLPKKEQILLHKELAKLQTNLNGIRNMKKVPDAIFVIDTNREGIALHEAHRLEIPVVGTLDTNCDPDDVDYGIPANDDAIRSVRLLADFMADAVIAGTGADVTAAEMAGEAAAADAVAEVAVEAAADVAEGAGAEVAADVVADTVSE